MQNTIENTLTHAYVTNHPYEVGKNLEQLNIGEIEKLFKTEPVEAILSLCNYLTPEITANALITLPKEKLNTLAERLGFSVFLRILLNSTKLNREQLLATLQPALKRDFTKALSFPDYVVGSIMDYRILFLRDDMTVKETKNLLQKFPLINRGSLFIVDEQSVLKKMIDFNDLLFAKDNAILAEFAKPIPCTASMMEPKDNLPELFDKYRLDDIPVVDADNRLVGIVRYDTLFEISKNEAMTDLQTMVGVSKDERALSPVTHSIRKRLPWLYINLLTAFLAAATVGLFENTIAKFTALAVLLPIVAGQSGNTGAQALAVTMRGLALREIRISQWLRIFYKETYLGLINGLAIALITALSVVFWSDSYGLGFIIGISMVIAMVIASIAGAAVPLVLTRLGMDPAQSSSIILTTVTDVMGFLSFLGIATLLSSFI